MQLENTTLNKAVLESAIADGALGSGEAAALEKCRQQVLADENLLKVYSELYDNIFERGKFEFKVFCEIDEFSCIFRMLMALNWIPRTRAVFEKNSWGEAAMLETASDAAVWARHCRENFGFYGYNDWSKCLWLSNHGSGRLVQQGRLQFNIDSVYRHSAVIYRNRTTREVIALAADNAAFDQDGFPAVSAEKIQWTARFSDDGTTAVGSPILPTGVAENRVVTLDLTQWYCALRDGDKVINFHIPETGPMTVERCRDSVERAVKFFAEYFPDYPWKAIHISSWFNDPYYEKYLPPTANIIKFRTAGYLLPEAELGAPVPRVFPGKTPYAGGSSLQNAVYRMLEEKIPFRRGTLLLLKEDLPWRENVYRKGN